MHNNSLRHNLAPHNRQQSRLLRNINRLPPQENSSPLQQRSSNPIIRVTNDCHQHSELKWLQKVVYDMKRYKVGPQKVEEKEIVNRSIQQVQKRKGLSDQTNLNLSLNHGKHLKQSEKVLEPAKKSGKKIKFEVYSNKQNKIPSERRSTSKGKLKTKKMSEGSTRSHEKNTKTQIQFTNYQTQSKKDPLSRVINIEPCVTEQHSRAFLREQAGSLWQDRNKTDHKPLEKSFSWRKSAGKIVKNTKTEESRDIYSTNLQKKSSQEPQSIQKPIQKVYIKLETENLSKYLNQSSINQSKVDEQIETEEYHKCCPTKREIFSQNKPVEYLQIRNDLVDHERTERIQKRILKSEEKIEKNPLKVRKYSCLSKQIRPVENDSGVKQESRVKSQQRRFNNNIQNDKLNKKQQQNDCKDQQILRQNPLHSQIKSQSLAALKSKFFYQKQNDREKNNEKTQKLFTLHSEGEEHCCQGSNMQNQPEIQGIEAMQYEKYFMEGSEYHESAQVPSNKPRQIEDLTCSPINSVETSLNIELKALPSLEIDCLSENYDKQLTLLFNFLDESKRNLLTSSNCRVEGFTEELKLLFSSIINQIKTKKRVFNLQKFIKESTAVLKIKKEVYSSSSLQSKSNIIGQILKENIELLKKKSPLELVKQTHTRSYFQTNSNSKRESFKDNKSIVLARMMNRPVQIVKQIPQKRYNFREKMETKEIDIEEPELFFQKKYGIVSIKREPLLIEINKSSGPRNSSFEEHIDSS